MAQASTEQQSLWKTLKPDEQTRLIIFWVVVTAIATALITNSVGDDVWDMGSNIATELVGAVFTLIIFQRIIDGRDKAKAEEQLLRDVRSRVNDVALSALDTFRERGQLEDGTLSDKRFWNANWSGANLDFANLSESKLDYANLSGVFLREANLSGANLGAANLSGADLWNANLSGVHLLGAKLSRVYLRYATLTGSNLAGANLSGANLVYANLSGANLVYANLAEANLSDANLSGAVLRDANLSGADFLGAKLPGADLEKARFDENTTLPDGTQWTSETDLTRFTDPEHPNFWKP